MLHRYHNVSPRSPPTSIRWVCVLGSWDSVADEHNLIALVLFYFCIRLRVYIVSGLVRKEKLREPKSKRYFLVSDQFNSIKTIFYKFLPAQLPFDLFWWFLLCGVEDWNRYILSGRTSIPNQLLWSIVKLLGSLVVGFDLIEFDKDNASCNCEQKGQSFYVWAVGEYKVQEDGDQKKRSIDPRFINYKWGSGEYE